MLPATTPPAEAGDDRLEALFARVRSANPFTDNRVNGPGPDAVDVAEIHATAFKRLTALARESLDERRGLGVLLTGEAGAGKSHLLARLVRWASGDGRACAVYLHNLQAGPDALPRSLLRAAVSILTRGRTRDFRGTPLYELVTAFVSEALRHDQSRLHPWPAVRDAYRRGVERLSEADPSRAALVDRTAYDVLYRFFRAVYRAPKHGDDGTAGLAVRWLAGDALDPADARRLGLPARAGEPVELADNQQVKQVLVALSRLALSKRQPFLLCFDQVDNLEDAQAAALARFLEALIDSSPNLLVVTAGIKASLLRWRETKVFQDSAWDRLAQFEVFLPKLTPAEGRRVVAARLDRFFAPSADVEAVGERRQDDLFPLGRAWAENYFGDRPEVRPRDVVNAAREAWRQEQEALGRLGGPAWLDGWPVSDGPPPPPPAPDPGDVQAAIDRRVLQKLAAHEEQRRSHPDTLPPDAGNLQGLLAALLRQDPAVALDWPPAGRSGRQYPYSFVVRRQSGDTEWRAGLLFLGSGSATSTSAALRRVAHDPEPPDRVLLVTDRRQPPAFGMHVQAKGREYYDELRGRGRFRHVELTFEQYARLDALQAVVGMARAGDLEVEPSPGTSRPVTEQEVVESLRRQGCYREAPVLRELLTATPEPATVDAAASRGL